MTGLRRRPQGRRSAGERERADPALALRDMAPTLTKSALPLLFLSSYLEAAPDEGAQSGESGGEMIRQIKFSGKLFQAFHLGVDAADFIGETCGHGVEAVRQDLHLVLLPETDPVSQVAAGRLGKPLFNAKHGAGDPVGDKKGDRDRRRGDDEQGDEVGIEDRRQDTHGSGFNFQPGVVEGGGQGVLVEEEKQGGGEDDAGQQQQAEFDDEMKLKTLLDEVLPALAGCGLLRHKEPSAIFCKEVPR